MADEPTNELEPVAALAHEVWVGWMRYLYEVSSFSDNDDLIVPAEYVRRWRRQMDARYTELPEGEKASDREIAQRYWNAVIAALTARLDKLRKAPWVS